ncbi:carbohydrate ABC transporter permease [Kitasatospora sp. SUK 42]|uniref:carbohydrate ABC transporter permease n=1 Tax=Kitasatospora sp. SUK 42 TaxID=1588882 RepID=UPI0018CB1AB3|nr:sugar ABC transporter permease [Kitasatospora sp. SUK 42]MBV2155673.1 sugar ABC transporter permease [Kitasatospora sp. SUK 42]
MKPRTSPRRLPDQVFAYALLVPAFAFLVLFTVKPLVSTVVSSLYDRRDEGPTLDNYRLLAEDEVFRKALVNNLLFSVLTVPVSLALAMLLAVLLQRALKGKALLRAGVFAPAILPVVAVAVIWLYFYQPNIGVINEVLGWFGVTGPDWLGDTALVLPSLMAMMVWKEAGFFMIFYLAGLQAIDPELDEASLLEGTGRFTHFRRVTFPLLMPTTLFAAIVALADSIKMVDFVFVMTQGGPDNASNLLLYYIYRVTFAQHWPQYGAAISLLVIGVLVALAVLQIRLLDRRIHYR